MAAPTVVHVESTQATATLAIPASTISTPAVGDLCIVARMGIAVSGTLADPVYTDNAANAGYTLESNVFTSTGNGKVTTYSKVLVSGDFSGGNFRQLTFTAAGYSVTTARLAIWIFRHPIGFQSLNSNRITSTANLPNGNAFTLNDSIAPMIAVAASGYAVGNSSQTIAWDGGTARAPYVDESTSTTTDGAVGNHYGSGTNQAQADHNLWDASDTVSSFAWQLGVANTTHAFATIQWRANLGAGITTATETDTASAVGWTKARAVGTASETDAGLAVSHSGGSSGLGQAAETDTAPAIRPTRSAAANTATETDTAAAIHFTTRIGTATETDTASNVAPYGTTSIDFLLSDPGSHSSASKTLYVWANKTLSGDAGDIQIALYQASTAVNTSGWVALTTADTQYALTISGTITDYTDLHAIVSVRSQTAVTLNVNQIELVFSDQITIATETDTALDIVRGLVTYGRPATYTQDSRTTFATSSVATITE